MLFQKPTYDWLIAGLGNPGPEYEKTRHNTGFMSLDLLAARLQVKVSKERFKALTAQADFDGQRLLLMKPQTYMNASSLTTFRSPSASSASAKTALPAATTA